MPLTLIAAVCQAAEPDWQEIGKFTLGAASIMPVHEAGHAITAMAVGAEITGIGYDYVNFKFHGNGSFAKLRAFSLSGYLAQNIAAEIILQNKSWHDDSFALGMFSAAHYVNLSNAVRFLRKQGDADNDISMFSSFGGNGYVLSALLLAYTAYSVYRVDRDTDMADYFKRNLFRVSFNF